MDQSSGNDRKQNGIGISNASTPFAVRSQDIAAGTEKSWGDKYKTRALTFTRNVGINFIVNFAISALGTYALLKSPLHAYLQKGMDGVARWAVAMGAHPELGKFLGEFLVRTQLLLCGGHLLLWPVKFIHDHRKNLEFRMGHRLDAMQEFLGQGNEASGRNLKDYRHIRQLLRTKPETLNPEDQALLKKHAIRSDYTFDEKPESWKHVLTARGIGVSCTTALSAVFALGSYYGKPERLNLSWIDVKENYLKKYGSQYGEKWLGKGLKKIGIHDAKLAGELIVLELLYTTASKMGFDYMERKLFEKQKKPHKATHIPKIQDRDTTPPLPAPIHQERRPMEPTAPAMTSAIKARKILVEAQRTDFRSRKTVKTQIALS